MWWEDTLESQVLVLGTQMNNSAENQASSMLILSINEFLIIKPGPGTEFVLEKKFT